MNRLFQYYFAMRPSLTVLLFVSLGFNFGIESACAQSKRITRYQYPSTGGSILMVDFTISEPFIPYSDSGQWVPAEIDITNNLDTPDTISLALDLWQVYSDSVIGGWRFSMDTGYAGSLRDSIIIPAHTHTPDLRFNAFFCWPRPDTLKGNGGSLDVFDGYTLPTESYSEYFFGLTGVGNCAKFDGIMNRNALINQNTGKAEGDTLFWVSGQDGNSGPSRLGFNFRSPSESPLSASFKVIGEYADSFQISCPNPILPDTFRTFIVSFSGAPQHIVHDTIVGTYSNCLFSLTERKPIIGNTIFATTHTLRFSPDTTIIPFVGETPQYITIRNLTPLRMEAYNFKETHQNPYEFLPLWPSSNVLSIAPFDSGSVEVLARDNPEFDLDFFRWHDDTVRFDLRLPDQPDMITDTAVRMDLLSYVNVYCPEYFSDIPELIHGIHPAGIVFGNYDSPFKTTYGNSDNENYEFFQPYFDDPQFQISIEGTMPRIVTPTIGDWMYATTTFNGDKAHDNRTQLHWPRIRVRDGMLDTVTIDVVEIGINAPPYQPTFAVNELSQEHFTLWPNPATKFISIVNPNGERLVGTISDILGRDVKQFAIEGENNQIDIRDIPQGFYLLRIPSIGVMSQVSIVR